MPSARDKFLIDLLVSNGLMSAEAGDAILQKKQSLDDQKQKINLISLLVREGYVKQADVPKVNELVLKSSGRQEESDAGEYPVAVPVDEAPLPVTGAPAPPDEDDIPQAIPARRPLLIKDLLLSLVLLCSVGILIYVIVLRLERPVPATKIKKQEKPEPEPEKNARRPSGNLDEYLGIGLALLERKTNPAEAAKELESKASEGSPFGDADLLLSAEALRMSGDVKAAGDRLSEIPEDFPAAAYRNLIAARVAVDLKDYAMAITLAGRALEENPEIISARLARGAAYFYGGRFDDALQDLNAYITARPRDAAAKSVRGLLLAAAGKRGAIDDLDYAISKRPDFRIALVRGAIALDAGDSGIARNSFVMANVFSPERAEPLAFIALAEISDNQMLTAEKHIRAARALDNSSRLADIAEALMMEKSGDLERACGLLDRGIEKLDEETLALAFVAPPRPLPPPEKPPRLAPKSLMPNFRARVFLTRAKCLISLGRFNEAEADLAKLTHSPGEPARPECYRGLVAESQGDFAAAEAAYSRGIRSGYASRWRVRCLTGRARARLGLGKREAAIDDLEQAVTIGVECADAAWLLAEERFAAGDYRKARLAANSLLKSEPRNADALLLRGKTYMLDGSFERAYEDFSLAIIIRPDSAEAYAARAESRAGASGDSEILEQSLKDISEAVRLEPSNLEYRLKLAEAAVKTGKIELAYKELSEAAGLEPGRMDIIFHRAEIAALRRDYVQALKDYSDAADAGHRAGEAWLAIALIHEETSRPELARSAYAKAGEAEEGPPEMLPFYLARLDFREKKYADARKTLTKTFLKEKDIAEAWELSGEIDLKLRKPKSAITAFNSAIRIDKLNGRYYYLRGLARYRLSQHRLALDDFLTAKSFNPELENLESYIEAARAALKEQRSKGPGQ